MVPTANEAELVEQGVTPILRYDALGRLIRTDLPNGTYSKVVFDPWREVRHDPNDTVEDSLWYAVRSALPTSDPERRAADKAYAHRDTPSVVHVDSLGRPFLTIEDNGDTEQYETRVALDIEGNALSIADHRGVVVQENVYGMGGHKLYQKSCDAGERWMLGDIAGTLLRAWDGRGFTRRAAYDAARRVTHLYVTPEGEDEMLVEYTVYGEALSSPAALNHRGRVYQHYDGAGVVTSVAFDFKGNLLQGQRRIATVYDATVDWIALDALTDPAAIATAASSALESETFTTATVYDALNRPTSITTPDASEIRPGYNEAGLLETVDVRIRDAGTWTAFVADIDYDAKGQREQIVYGANATTTKYKYDPLTFRMTQLKTTRAAGDPEDEEDDDVLQNLQYTYDPVGNITEIKDSAQQTVFFNDDVVLPVMAYTYDALYRLTQATGRELTAIAAFAPDLADVPVSLPHANDMSAVRNYAQEYVYDAVGNILQMVHKIGATPEWTRNYKYEVDGSDNPISNRLVATSAFADEDDFSATYGYDEHGNMVSMPHLSTVAWNHRDEMASADLGGGGVVYFTYDSAGQRVRKVYEHSGLIEERIYLGGFEIYRKWVVPTGLPKELTLERETLHVMDGERRIALVETKTVDASISSYTPETVTRLQLGNHLGSTALEVDLTGAVISYEEYHPYGTTAYQAASGAVEVSRKRYRYTGKERDEETGLYYHGARYYAPWLGRWTAADPAGIAGGAAGYTYSAANPLYFTDRTGLAPDASTAEMFGGKWMAFDPDEGTYVPIDYTDATKSSPRVGTLKPSGSFAVAERKGQRETVPLWYAQLALRTPGAVPDDVAVTVYTPQPNEDREIQLRSDVAAAVRIQAVLEREHVVPPRLTDEQGGLIAGPIERDPSGGYRVTREPAWSTELWVGASTRGSLRSGGGLPPTGVARFDALVHGSPIYDRWVRAMGRRGFGIVETNLPLGDAAHISPDKTLRLDPTQFRYIDLLHESRHAGQISRAVAIGEDPFNKNNRSIFEYGAYKYEQRLGTRFGFSSEYMQEVQSRASFYFSPSVRKAYNFSPTLRSLWK